VAFFDEIPEQEPEEELSQRQLYFDNPGEAPQHWLPGVAGVGAVIGRTAHTAVRITFAEVYPRGVAIEVQALLDPSGPDVDALHRHFGRPGRTSSDLRLGMLWPDGRRTETASEWYHGPHQEVEPRDGNLMLRMHGGGGGGLAWHWRAWLWPLPPAGPVEVYLRWDARDIPETMTTIDLTPVVAAAADAEELWPLPEPPQGEYGWFSHSPMSSSSTVTAVRVDDDLGDAADPGDEDG
jgi:hypothetical protein